jgi:uncharacterized membrane protein YfcA
MLRRHGRGTTPHPLNKCHAEARMSPLFVLGGLALGAVIGVISGMVGIGGGALLIPALVYFYGMSQIKAQGTSIATLLLPIGCFAFWTYYKAGHVDFKLAMLVAAGFAVGGYFGGAWAQHLSQVVLRRSFAALLVIIAAKLAFER